ncbi:MAG: 30S ribosome-binding factor RbfA [Oligoflexales bacterium]
MGLRQDRVADQIRDVIAIVFSRGDVRDPRLQDVTVTYVKVSADLQMASVYFRCYGDKSEEEMLAGFKQCAGFLRKQLGGKIDLRRVPELRFFYDASIERGERIESLLIDARSEMSEEPEE